ncbi:hypothetical protein FOZ60_010053, partial [Perkinsus olseni]
MYLPPLKEEGCRFVGIISATCISTEWLRAVPITGFSGQQAAESLDPLFYNTVIPRVLIVDQGSKFIAADTLRSWAAKRQIRLKYFRAASSSLAGWVERPHKGLRDHLRPMLLDKEDPSLVGENNWMTRLPRAVYAWNAASYNSNSVLSPYMMVYGVPPRTPGAELTTDDEELAQLGIDHLIGIPSWTALLQQMNDSRRITRDVTMREYIALWRDLRDKARSSLTRRTKTREVIRVGDFVRILRPKQLASECTIVVSARVSVIRVVDSSHRVSDEYIGNIVLAKNDPPNKDVLLECKESYDRDDSFPDLPATAVTRELHRSEIAKGSLRTENLIEKLSTLPVCSPDNLTIDFIAADKFRSLAAKRQIRLKYFPVASSSLAGWDETKAAAGSTPDEDSKSKSFKDLGSLGFSHPARRCRGKISKLTSRCSRCGNPNNDTDNCQVPDEAGNCQQCRKKEHLPYVCPAAQLVQDVVSKASKKNPTRPTKQQRKSNGKVPSPSASSTPPANAKANNKTTAHLVSNTGPDSYIRVSPANGPVYNSLSPKFFTHHLGGVIVLAFPFNLLGPVFYDTGVYGTGHRVSRPDVSLITSMSPTAHLSLSSDVPPILQTFPMWDIPVLDTMWFYGH